MVVLEIKKKKTIPEAGVFRISLEVLNATNITPNVFVKETEDNTFAHVATVFDLLNWGSTSATSEAFYRDDKVVLDYDNSQIASEVMDTLIANLELVAKNVQEDIDQFELEETIEIEG